MNSYVLYISICLYLSIYSHSLQGDKGNDQMPPGELVFIGELWNGAEGARIAWEHLTISHMSSELCEKDPCLAACFGHKTLRFAIITLYSRVLYERWGVGGGGYVPTQHYVPGSPKCLCFSWLYLWHSNPTSDVWTFWLSLETWPHLSAFTDHQNQRRPVPHPRNCPTVYW